MIGACSTHGDDNRYKVLGGKLKGTTPLIRPSHRWKENTKMDLTEAE